MHLDQMVDRGPSAQGSNSDEPGSSRLMGKIGCRRWGGWEDGLKVGTGKEVGGWEAGRRGVTGSVLSKHC